VSGTSPVSGSPDHPAAIASAAEGRAKRVAAIDPAAIASAAEGRAKRVAAIDPAAIASAAEGRAKRVAAMNLGVRPLAIVGPTGTGKSRLALEIAERIHAGAEIVNADAMQLYRGMDVGTAKLSVAERRGIAHHQLDVLDVTETASVARYQQAAAADVEAIAARGAVPIVVGGSMLYVQSLLDDWSFPATDPQVRARWELRLAEVGVAGLHAELAQRDPVAAATILPTDARRIVRALEVVELTGQPFAASTPAIKEPRWGTLIVGLDCDTEFLDEQLAHRTDAMFEQGLVEEVTGLLEHGLRDGVTASRALGYAQVIAVLDAGGGAPLSQEERDSARQQTYVGTRRYVRRQRSWFRRDHRIRWLDVSAVGADADIAEEVLRMWRHVS
jgi:tRNA dimethylallyltransferase